MAYGNNTHSASFDEMLHVGLECFNLNVHRVILDASSDRFTGSIFLLLCLLLNSSILVLRLATTSPPNSPVHPETPIMTLLHLPGAVGPEFDDNWKDRLRGHLPQGLRRCLRYRISRKTPRRSTNRSSTANSKAQARRSPRKQNITRAWFRLDENRIQPGYLFLLAPRRHRRHQPCHRPLVGKERAENAG